MQSVADRPRVGVVERRMRLRPLFSRSLSLVPLVVIGALVLAPFLYALATSLRLPNESFNEPPQWIPSHPVWSNYSGVFQQVPFASYFVNSALVTGCIVAGQVATCAMAGYAFGRLEFPGRQLLFWLVLATMMVPLQATIIPVFIEIKQLGLADNLLSLILPAYATAFGTFLMRQYFMQIPKDYDEAGLIDGANQLQIFWHINLPLVRSPLIVVGLLAFAAYWNEFFRPLIFLQSATKFTLPLGLVSLQGYLGTGSIAIVLAGFIVSLVPSVAVFLFGQRYLMAGLTAGGVKG